MRDDGLSRVADESGEPDAAWDEELGSDDRPWWCASIPRQCAVGAVTLLTVAGVVAAAWAGAGHPQAHEAGHVAPTPAPVTHGSTGVSLAAQIEAIMHCPPSVACSAADGVPAATTAAIAEYLSGAYERQTVTVTQVDPRRLYYRAVNATAGAVELLVIVSTSADARPQATDSVDPVPGAAIRYVRRQIGRYEVQIQYTGPPGATPPVELAVRLAVDPRLLVPE
jgi:hypothetical protein